MRLVQERTGGRGERPRVARLVLLTLGMLALWAAPAEGADGEPKRITGYLHAPDGTALRYSVVLPEAEGKFPVVVDYSGYASGSVGSPEVPLSSLIQKRLLDAGYATLGVSMRGTGCSEGGPFVTFDPRWGTDGRRMIEWAAKQPWSNGRIGMQGFSFNGFSQLWTASARPPSLRAIAPGMVVVDPYRDVAFPGGVKNWVFPTAWWADIKATWLDAREAAVREGDARCVEAVDRNIEQAEAASTTPVATLNEHPVLDRFMRRHSLVGRTGRINVPVLSLEAYQDDATGVRGGYYQETLNPRKTWYVATNGDHGMYFNARFIEQNLIPFLDHFVKGERNGFGQRPKVELWQDTVGPAWWATEPSRIVNFDSYPPPTRPLTLHLRSGERLKTGRPAPGEGSERYRYPVPGPNVNDARFVVPGVTDDRYAGAWDELDPKWRRGSVAFTSRKLRKPLTVWGSASADLWVKTTARNPDIQVTVTAVHPDGQEQYLQRGWLRLSHRALKRSDSTRTRPVHRDTARSLRRSPRRRPALARVEIRKLMHTFRAGSRIRIWLDAPSITGRWGFRIRKNPGRITVKHNRHYPSRIVFGRLRVKPPDYPAPECGAALFEPCRPDPLATPR